MPIFDQGYQHWSGHLSGHASRWLAVTRQGVRTGWKNTWLRRVLTLAWLPAVALVTVLCIWGLIEQKSELVARFVKPLSNMLGINIEANPIKQRVEVWTICYSRFMVTELLFSLLLITIVGPNLISRDLRFNAIPLYFSRPLRRADYFLGKLGVIGAFIGMVMVVPAIIAYLLGLLFSLDITIAGDTFPLLLASILYGVIVSVSAGMLMLAISSLTRNSRYVALLWIALCFISFIVSLIMEDVEQTQRVRSFIMQNRGYPTAADTDFAEGELSASKTDWRPAVSYVGNLWRIGREILGTDAAWDKLAGALPPGLQAPFRVQTMGPLYPWTWSAGVLFVIFLLSTCILNLRVRSLDRLK
jgi:ABC-2 type transport system permease protein